MKYTYKRKGRLVYMDVESTGRYCTGRPTRYWSINIHKT